jgi:hypothetical protein
VALEHIHRQVQQALLVKEILVVEMLALTALVVAVEQVERERTTLELLAVPVELAQLIPILLLQLALVSVVNTLAVAAAVHTVVEVLELLTVAVVLEALMATEHLERLTLAVAVAVPGKIPAL